MSKSQSPSPAVSPSLAERPRRPLLRAVPAEAGDVLAAPAAELGACGGGLREAEFAHRAATAVRRQEPLLTAARAAGLHAVGAAVVAEGAARLLVASERVPVRHKALKEGKGLELVDVALPVRHGLEPDEANGSVEFAEQLVEHLLAAGVQILGRQCCEEARRVHQP